MNLLDILLPAAREFRWAILPTLPALAYPVKPYQSVSISRRTVIDATGQLWHFSLEAGRITKWSNQFNTFPDNSPVKFWDTLTPRQRRRITFRWERQQVYLRWKQIKALRPLHLQKGF